MPSFRLKRGNSEKVGAYVGTSGELIYNTETKKVVVMDGVNAGGITLGGSEVVDVNNPPAFETVLPASTLLANEVGNKLERRTGDHTLAVQENQDTIYWVSSTNASQDAANNGQTNAIYSVSKNDFNGWLQAANSSSGFAVPPISDLPSYQVISGLAWWTWMNNNGGRPSAVTKKYPAIFIDKQSTGANPVAYLVFWDEKRPDNTGKPGRAFIATGSNLENLQELLLPTINGQMAGHPALVDANAGGAFDEDQTAPDNGLADMDPNFWGSTTQPTFVVANATHIFVMIQWWGINVYLKDGTYVKSLKHPVLGFYNSGYNHEYLDSTQNRPNAAMFCTDDRFVVVSADGSKSHKYYENMDATYRDAAPGTLEAAKFDMFWGEIAVYTGDGTYINTIKNPMTRQNGEFNSFAYSAPVSVNLLSNNILTVYNMDSQLIENGLGATNGIADGTTLFEEGAIHIYDLNTMTHINTVQNTDPDIVGWSWTFSYYQSFGPRAIPDGTNDCILLIASDDNKDIWRAVRGSTGEILDTHTNVSEDDLWGWHNNYSTGAASIHFAGSIVQLDDGTIVLSGVSDRDPPNATIFKVAGEVLSKLKLGDNKFLKLPTDSSYELDITKTKLSDFTNDVGFALGSQIPTVPTTLSSFTNDVGFAVGTIPTALSELTNDSGFAVGTIPTALSQLNNDSGFATTSQIPTALSQLANDTALAYTSQIPTVLSALTNDAGFATTAQIPTALSELTNDASFATTAQIPTALSELTNDAGFATGTIPTALSQLTNDAGLGKKNKQFRQWSTSSVDNPILSTSNIILPSQEKAFHYLTENPTADFTINLTGEAALVGGSSLSASYTSVDDYISTGGGEINGTGNSSGRIVTACPAFALLWWDDNGNGTYKIGRITDGRGYVDGKYDSGYLGYDVSWNPGGTLTAGQTLAISGGTEWKFPGGTPSNTANIGAPLYLGSSWPGDMTAANKAGYYLRSVPFEVYTTGQNWQPSTTFNETLEIGESTKVEVMVDIGATAYKANSLEIDGVSQTVKWLGGTAPTGTANSRDVYSFEILKTADSTYSVLGEYKSYS